MLKFTQRVLAVNIDRPSPAVDRPWRAFIRYFISDRECNTKLLTRVRDIERSVFRLQVEQPKPIIGEHNTEKAQPMYRAHYAEKIRERGKLTTAYYSAVKYYAMLLLSNTPKYYLIFHTFFVCTARNIIMLCGNVENLWICIVEFLSIIYTFPISEKITLEQNYFYVKARTEDTSRDIVSRWKIRKW